MWFYKRKEDQAGTLPQTLTLLDLSAFHHWTVQWEKPSPDAAPQGFLGLQNRESNNLLWFMNQPGSVIVMD